MPESQGRVFQAAEAASAKALGWGWCRPRHRMNAECDQEEQEVRGGTRGPGGFFLTAEVIKLIHQHCCTPNTPATGRNQGTSN